MITFVIRCISRSCYIYLNDVMAMVHLDLFCSGDSQRLIRWVEWSFSFPNLTIRSNENLLSVLFVMPYKLVLTFKSVDETLDHSNKSYWAVLSCGTVYYAAQGVLTFKSADETLGCDHSLLSCCTVYYAVQGGSNFEVHERNPSVFSTLEINESYWAVLSCDTMSIFWCTRWF